MGNRCTMLMFVLFAMAGAAGAGSACEEFEGCLQLVERNYGDPSVSLSSVLEKGDTCTVLTAALECAAKHECGKQTADYATRIGKMHQYICVDAKKVYEENKQCLEKTELAAKWAQCGQRESDCSAWGRYLDCLGSSSSALCASPDVGEWVQGLFLISVKEKLEERGQTCDGLPGSDSGSKNNKPALLLLVLAWLARMLH